MLCRNLNKTLFFSVTGALLLACPMSSRGDTPLEHTRQDRVSRVFTNDVQDLDSDIVVTPRGRPTRISRTPGGIGVVRSENIRDRHLISLPDAFMLVPGAWKISDSPWGSEVNIRGMSRDSVVFLIDGSRVNTATDINARFGFVDPLEISRVEILKGPVSSLFGSGSLGGVVSVLTRSGHFTETTQIDGGLSTIYGDNPQGLHGFGYTTLQGPRSYVYLSQSWRDFETYKDGDGDTVRNSQYADRQTKLKFGYQPDEVYTIEANLQVHRGEDIGIPGAGTAPLPVAADVTYPDTERGLISVVQTLRPPASVLEESQLNLYYQYINREVRIDNFPPAQPLESVHPKAHHETIGSKWKNLFCFEQHDVTTGLDVWERRLTLSERTRYLRNGTVLRDQPLPEPSLLSSGLFLEDDWDFRQNILLNFGGRFDMIDVKNQANANWEKRDETEHSWNAHLGATWKLTRSLSMKIIGASGYRAASLEERYQYLELGGGQTKYGNPELEPERSRFAETGLQWENRKAVLSVAAMYNDLRDLIGERQVDPGTLVNDNVDEARIYGFEAEGHWRLPYGMKLYGNIARTIGRDTRSDQYLPFLPPLSGFAGLSIGRSAGLWARAETQFAARQDDVPPDTEEAPGWAIMNLAAGCDIHRGPQEHGLFVELHNVLDKNYRNYLTTCRGSTYNEPGRSVSIGYRLTF